jgi:hypothetical protein
VTVPIRREMRRRAAVEPVIGHAKAEHRMGRNYLKGRNGDRINAVLAAAGYNFNILLRWLARLLRALVRLLLGAPLVRIALITSLVPYFTDDLVPRTIPIESPHSKRHGRSLRQNHRAGLCENQQPARRRQRAPKNHTDVDNHILSI